jgi:predicted phosphoribosyltransferase
MRKQASREERYGAENAPPVVRGRTVILVDEGLAAGITMRAAVRSQHPARVVVAAPVGSVEAVTMLEREADDVVCRRVPDLFGAASR